MKREQKIFHRLVSLRSRYGISIIIFVLLLCVLNVFQFLFMDDIFIKAAKQNLAEAGSKVEQLSLKSESFFKDVSNLEASYNVFVEIYKPKDSLVYSTNINSWIYDTQSGKPKTDELKPRIMKILSHKDINASEYYEERQEFYADAKYIVYGISENNKTIELYYSVDVINANTKTASNIVFIISLLILFLAVALTYFYTSAFIAPLERITGITKRMTRMEFDKSCPQFRIKELSELSENINALSASLELTLRDLQSKNKRLEKDIEREHDLEQMRKQFIANASHELKTPISIIQGYAEGIKCGAFDESPEEYCDIIIDEAQKMNNLVLRLLEMTHYDYGGFTPKCSLFNIRGFVEGYLGTRLRSIGALGIELEVDIDPHFEGYGDTQMLSDVLGNYISNAVSHCSGEKKIKITCKEHDSVFTVSVFNTGDNIAKDDLDHIWESFYRADKARSRANGRFGLGLAIAASAQEKHKQKYGVINRENGVEFWFNIAKTNIPD